MLIFVGHLNGSSVTDSVNGIYINRYKCLNITDNLGDAIDLFKNKTIKFLPIVDKDGVLVNVITKAQLHVVLLQDINADLSYSFDELDDSVVDYEIYQHKITKLNDYFQSKIISIKLGQQLSLQSHNYHEEYWIVAHGIRCGPNREVWD